jgi:hypothetical protein
MLLNKLAVGLDHCNRSLLDKTALGAAPDIVKMSDD